MATTATVTAPAQENIPTVLRNKPSAIVKPLHCSKSTTTTDRPALAGVVNQTGPVTRSRRNGEGAKQTRAVTRRTVTTRATTNRETEVARGGEATRTQQDRREEGGEQGTQRGGGRRATRTTRTRATAAATRGPQHTAGGGQNPPTNSEPSDTTKRPSVTTLTTKQTTAAVGKGKKAAKKTQKEAGPEEGAVAISRPLRVAANARSRKGATTTSNVTADVVRPVPKPRKNIPRPTTTAVEQTVPSQTTVEPQTSATEAAQPVKASSRPSSKELVPFVPEASIDSTEDPSMCGEYSADVYVYHRQLEEQSHYVVCATFMEHQTSISSVHRCVLVNWLAQVHFKYRLLQETMILTIDILDRYLQVVVVPKPQLQLVGLASLLISSKVEEIYAPSVHDLLYMAAQTYTREEILKMEKTILHGLDFRVLKPYPLHFLRRYSRLSRIDTNVHHLAKYFIDLSLLETTTSCLLPSKKAAAAFIIARTLANIHLYRVSSGGEKVWTEYLIRHTGYTYSQLTDAIAALVRAMAKIPRHSVDLSKAIREKYVKNAPTKEVKSLIENRLEKIITTADKERVITVLIGQTES